MNDNATLSIIISCRQARRFLRIPIAKSAALIHAVLHDSPS